MENKMDFKLVHGKFSTEEAGRILYELIGRKINFHNMEKFSLQERSEADTSHHEERIAELRASRSELKAFIEQAEGTGKKLKIESVVKISLVKA